MIKHFKINILNSLILDQCDLCGYRKGMPDGTSYTHMFELTNLSKFSLSVCNTSKEGQVCYYFTETKVYDDGTTQLYCKGQGFVDKYYIKTSGPYYNPNAHNGYWGMYQDYAGVGIDSSRFLPGCLYIYRKTGKLLCSGMVVKNSIMRATTGNYQTRSYCNARGVYVSWQDGISGDGSIYGNTTQNQPGYGTYLNGDSCWVQSLSVYW